MAKRKDSTREHEIDTCMLGHARVFDAYLREPPESSGLVLSVGTLSERQQNESILRLESGGHLAPAGEWYSLLRGRRGRRYQVTDAGRAEYRRRSGTPRLTVDHARTMHVTDLKQVYGDVVIAQQQIELRRRGEAIARGALRTLLGHGYDGTQGWHVIAFASPDGRLGYVNTAQGHAVLTDVQMEADVVEALTVPDQGEGPKASGAAAWTSPDAGEAKRAQAPRGWVQLVLDLRGQADPVPCTARVCAWGLRTCYGHRGAPGAQRLDAFDGASKLNPWARLDALEWPITREQRDRMYAAGEPILRGIALRLAEIAGAREAVETALDQPSGEIGPLASVGTVPLRAPTKNLAGAVSATGAYDWEGSAYDGANAARMVSGDSDSAFAANALRNAGVTQLCALAGDIDQNRIIGARYYDVCLRLLERILRRELTPAAEALWSTLEPHATRNQHGEHWHLYLHQVQPLLRQLAPKMADLIMERDVVPDGARETIYAALYDGDYIEISVPVVPPAPGQEKAARLR